MPCTLDEVLGPPTTPEGRSEESSLLEQLVSFLSGTDESELAELDKALGIDKLVQVCPCWWGCGRGFVAVGGALLRWEGLCCYGRGFVALGGGSLVVLQ